PGRPQPTAPAAATPVTARGGDVSLDFPGVDVQAVAKAVLGDLLHQPYSVAPDLHTPVTLTPGRRIPRASVLPVFEGALSVSGLALVAQPAGGYAILPAEQAKAVAPLGEAGVVGYGSEAVRLHFVNAEELRKLIDPVLPGVVTGADTAADTLTIAGTEGQRAAARDLVRQFDVDWLRGASFALYVPRRTDSRLIVPELDKVLNAEGAPTRNMVRLIAMDRLNGILAVSTQPQYLEDVRRWVEILDREGENSSRRLFVYRVQNGRAGDLARTLASAFGQGSGGPVPGRNGGLGFSDSARPPGVIGSLPSDGQPSSSGVGGSGIGSSSMLTPSPGSSNSGSTGSSTGSSGAFGSTGSGASGGGLNGGGASGGTSVDVQADDFHAKITSDEVNNAIVVYATPRDYAVVEDALRKLDIAPYQVVIEAAIAEVTLTDALQFGIQGLFNNAGLSVGLTQSAASAAPAALLPGFNALYAARTVSGALSTLESMTKVKVISAPKLMVLNNQTASIEVGNQVPILTGSATSVITSDAPVVNSVDYRDTGIILKVTPRVNSSGYVLLDLAQEVSDVVPAGSSSTINSPSFSTRRIATSVAVQDGQIIALGGLIRDNRDDVSSGLPGLSRIPVLGPLLFGNINNNDTRTELIVMLRPSVVRNADDGRAVTEELREKLKGLRGLLPDRNVIP
ncbi:type II secretion system secretin GspD, partial [Caulobacter sp. S45]|uniref:type II secretion system secretin GspD n=1 Tax=Caulobacter sp. S45 TaxID=1641861 RepID=UPI001C2CCA0C